MRVFVVADDDAVLEMIAHLLRREGFETILTHHGADAMRVVVGPDIESYAAIVVQVNATPSRLDARESTGVALLKHLRLQKPDLIARTVVVTTMPRLPDSIACTVVMQPFDIDEFIAAVRHCAARFSGAE